jgi:hypothetical protein
MIAAGRSDEASAGSRPPKAALETLAAGIRKARRAASAPFLRLGRRLPRAGWLVRPSEEPVEAARRLARDSVDPQLRRKVVASLEAELDDLVDDASGRGISDRAADELLLTVDILAWLRDGAEPPGWAAIELLEVQVALFNGARREDERETRAAFLDVLLLLLGEQVAALRGRLRRRRVNIETAEATESRLFGAGLEKLRISRELTVGDLAAGAGLDVVVVIGLLRGARAVSSSEVLFLADALQVDPGTLLPERPGAAAASRSPGVGAGRGPGEEVGPPRRGKSRRSVSPAATTPDAGGRAAGFSVPIDLPEAQSAILRDELESVLVGLAQDLVHLDRKTDPGGHAREVAAYGRLSAALITGRLNLPDEECRRAGERLASELDDRNEYERVVSEHEAFAALTALLRGAPPSAAAKGGR